MYAVLDDQINMSLASPKFFDLLQVESDEYQYTLSSCAGLLHTSGRRASGYVIESLNGNSVLDLPTLIECEQIPNARNEIPTPEVAQHHEHLNEIAQCIPALDSEADILLLLGRDIPEAHHVQQQIIGPPHTPYALKLSLGWVIVGEAYLGNVHKPETLNVYKTNILPTGRPSLFEPCSNKFQVKVQHPTVKNDKLSSSSYLRPDGTLVDLFANPFLRTPQDEQPGLSIEDRDFLNIMDSSFSKNQNGSWVAPLPFKSPRPKLPNNFSQASKRAKILDSSLQRNPVKKKHFFDFMAQIFSNAHAELAPALQPDEEYWYLPIFGVYHPRKPDQIRGVFDSSAQHKGVSLNDVLLSGPDLTNNLLGVLQRFRKEGVAIMADIQQMFYCFQVRKDHRNFLRFLWYRNNDPDDQIVEYRMCVHVFGNSPSPAVATYGLRKSAELAEKVYGSDMRNFVERNFYVDDGLTSLPTPRDAIDLLHITRQALASEGNLRLYKIASNSIEVMESFPTEDRAKDLKDLDFTKDILPTQRSLGLLSWNLKSDSFTFQVSQGDKPFTRRGILSTVNSLYDPVGFVAPVVIKGKLMLRDLISETKDWDDPLPPETQVDWEQWKSSLTFLQNLSISRTYGGTSLSNTEKKEILIFTDASEQAIAAVAYLKTSTLDGKEQLGFVLGKAKVAPQHGHTIPRLELCAAVLGVQIADIIRDQLDITPDFVRFFTDSKVVLGYLYNATRRFHIYVCNRVQRIRMSSEPEQWSYVRTDLNPADQGTRSIPAQEMQTSLWLTGPPHILTKEENHDDSFPLVDPNSDKELKPILVRSTVVNFESFLGAHRFERFSDWTRLIKAISLLKHVAHTYRSNTTCQGWHQCPLSKEVSMDKAAQLVVIRTTQKIFHEELRCLKETKPLPRNSNLISLNPFVDDQGILRVGGRLSRSDLDMSEKHPIIIPAHHHVGKLIIRHYHNRTQHQGRHLTEGAVRSAGFWILGGKRLISSVIHNCVRCRKLRGRPLQQIMSDLPEDRLRPCPPFTNVGVDMFGPWSVVTRKTRGGQANNKRWAILFTCLVSMAVHIEVVEDMTSSAFINSLRRFIAIRGKVSEFRSDRGTNFTGSVGDLGIHAINVEEGNVQNFLRSNAAVWIFNPPHSSHMGGVWERMIGITRRILDSLLTSVSSSTLTHEVLCTFMAEVSAIINTRPIVPVSSDPDSPTILSPSMLLTYKSDHVSDSMGPFDMKYMYKAQWRRVQALSDAFWKRWRQEYLPLLQNRRKWPEERQGIKRGDVVLLAEKNVARNQWPIGIIVNPVEGSDGRFRKAIIRITKDGVSKEYTRPITEIVALLSTKDSV